MMRSISETALAARDDASTPMEHPLASYLADLHAKHAACDEGEVATYIPELAKADPDWFGIAVATTDGHVYEVGDTRQPFTIQSISKPFIYGLALEDRGREHVLQQDRRRADRRRVQLDQPLPRQRAAAQSDDQRRRDRGDLAGARATRRATARAPARRCCSTLRRPRARRSTKPSTVRARHRATATSPSATCCATSTSSSDPGAGARPVLPAVLDPGRLPRPRGDGGDARQRRRQPAHRRAALDPRARPAGAERDGDLRHVRLRRRVGLPRRHAGEERRRRRHHRRAARAAGIGVFSPPLDARGNSVRGIRVFNDLSATSACTCSAPAALDALRRPSPLRRRRRSARSACAAPQDTGRSTSTATRIVVYELQGELTIFSVERVIRELLELPASRRRTSWSTSGACPARTSRRFDLFREFLGSARRAIPRVVLADVEHEPSLAAGFGSGRSTARSADATASRTETDAALELCEDRLLAELGARRTSAESIRLEQFEVCEGLDAAKIETLRSVLELVRYDAGDVIIRRGDPATCAVFPHERPSERHDRPADRRGASSATCTPGMLFGEMAIVERLPRSAPFAPTSRSSATRSRSRASIGSPPLIPTSR